MLTTMRGQTHAVITIGHKPFESLLWRDNTVEVRMFRALVIFKERDDIYWITRARIMFVFIITFRRRWIVVYDNFCRIWTGWTSIMVGLLIVSSRSRSAYTTAIGASLEARVRWNTSRTSSTAIVFAFFALFYVIIVTVTTNASGDRRPMVSIVSLVTCEKDWKITGIWTWINVMLSGRICRKDGVFCTCWIFTGRRNVMGCVLLVYQSKKRVDIIFTTQLLFLLLTGYINGRLVRLQCSCLFLCVDNASLNCFHTTA